MDLINFHHNCIIIIYNDTINALKAIILKQLLVELHVFQASGTSVVNEANLDFAQLPVGHI